MRYLREKRRLDPGSETERKGEVREGEEKEGGAKEEGEGKGQRVLVLRGGCTQWQEKYGEDERLTEGYDRRLWEEGGLD